MNPSHNDDSSLPPRGMQPVATVPTPLSALKVGDLVIVDSGRYGTENLTAVRIHRTTETLIILRYEREGMEPLEARYDRRTGYKKGRSAYDTESLRVPTPELYAKVEKQKLVARLSGIRWKDLHLDTLRAVSSAIKTQPNPTPEAAQ
jgi:hypothetical protein